MEDDIMNHGIDCTCGHMDCSTQKYKDYEPIEIYDLCYAMNLSGGGDLWMLHGEVFNHPNFPDGSIINPSSPVSFDEGNELLTTASERRYRVITYKTTGYTNKEKTIAQIKLDITRGGYEVH